MLKRPLSIESAVKNIAFILLGILITTVGQSTITSVATARVSPDQLHPAGSSSQAPATSQWNNTCVPVGIVTYSTRVHVQCQSAVSGIIYFAAPTADAANVARILSIITAAQVAGRTLSILYDPADTSGTAIGCAANDCRLIQAVGFGQ